MVDYIMLWHVVLLCRYRLDIIVEYLCWYFSSYNVYRHIYPKTYLACVSIYYNEGGGVFIISADMEEKQEHFVTLYI